VNFASSDLPSLIMLSKKILLYNDVPSAMHFTVRPEVTSYLDHTLSANICNSSIITQLL